MKHDGNIQMSNIEGEPSLWGQSVLLSSGFVCRLAQEKKGPIHSFVK